MAHKILGAAFDDGSVGPIEMELDRRRRIAEGNW